ncbi:MAG: hypothetical protein EOO20_20425, partial [Chryseobacterium sp.]
MKAPILLHTAEIQNKSSRQLYDEIVSLPVMEQCNKSNCCYSSTQQHPSSYSGRFSWIHPPTPHIKETLAEKDEELKLQGQTGVDKINLLENEITAYKDDIE